MVITGETGEESVWYIGHRASPFKGDKIKNVHPLTQALVPGVVLIPLQIVTKLSMTKSESIMEN